MPASALSNRGSAPGEMRLTQKYGVMELYSLLVDKLATIPTNSVYYACNEKPGTTQASDYLGKRPGVYHGSVTLQSYGPSDGAVTIPTSAYLTSSTLALNVSAADVMLWFSTDAYPVTESLIFGLVQDDSHWRLCLTLDASGTLKLNFSSDTDAYTQITNLPLKRWNYINFSWSPTSITSLQVNLLQLPSTSVLSSGGSGVPAPITFSNAGNIYIGGGPLTPFPGCPGTYDEIAIFEQFSQ